jgi:hypothetical protein
MSKPWREANKPPKDTGWLFISLEMMNSPAWEVAPAEVKLVVLRLVQEHHAHAGMENGRLQTTYDQFERFGISRRRIKWAVRSAQALGFIDVLHRGSAYGDLTRKAEYRLTFRPSVSPEMDMPTNRWKRFKTEMEALAALPEKLSTKGPPTVAAKKKNQLQGETIPVAG